MVAGRSPTEGEPGRGGLAEVVLAEVVLDEVGVDKDGFADESGEWNEPAAALLGAFSGSERAPVAPLPDTEAGATGFAAALAAC